MLSRLLKRVPAGTGLEEVEAKPSEASGVAAPRPGAKMQRKQRKIWGRAPFEDVLRDFGSMPDPKDTRPRAFFINGHPRSGTNWMSNLFNLHPLVKCHGEFHFHAIHNAMPEMVTEPHQAGFRDPMKTAVARGYQEFIRTVMASVADYDIPTRTAPISPEGVKFVGDHSPRLFRPMLPESAHFVIFRDGRDVVNSLTVHFLNTQSRKGARSTPEVAPLFERALTMCTNDDSSLYTAADWLLTQEPWVRRWAGVWAHHVLSDLDTLARIEAGEYPHRAMKIRYEDLHADTPGMLRRMFEFLGVDPDQAAPVGADPRTVAGYNLGKSSSHYRKGKVGDWRDHFSPQSRAWFADEARAALKALDYEADDRWVRSETGAS